MGADSERGGRKKSFNLIEVMTLNEIKCFTVALIPLFGTMMKSYMWSGGPETTYL